MKKHLFISAAAVMLLMLGCQKNKSLSTSNDENPELKKQTTAVAAYQDNTVTNFFKRTSGANAFDGAFSIRMADGRDVWLNNDSFYNQLNTSNNTLPCIFNNHNTTLLQPASHNWAPANTPTLTYLGSPTLFTPLNSSHWYWTTTGVEINGAAYVYCNEIAAASGGLGFTGVGQILGRLDLSTNAVTYTTLPALNGINFGVGMIKRTDGYVYVYGYKPQGSPSVAVNIYVARFPTSNPGSWTFWNGSSYVSAATSASIIGSAPSSGVFVSWVNNKAVMVSTQFNLQCDQGTAIYGCTSTNLTGPFTSQQVIYNIPDRNQGHTPFFYTPVIHPQFTANSEFLMTYCINTYKPCVPECVNGQFDPDSYRPRGVRVPFTVLGL
ncbi:DUF4185 domain-containing protein [Mucilaginibacter sp. Bleaf8]|uniref:DUF4185 domain-containing protein n=1 Tax=Mucilaginibacter sp. Bleaf8 TaxID=2834430 RepID=UPI001BCFAC24|nr:DUF4185 domain-containing protein [Mucilaginibacter sp. Bleaf8]MBS7564728.1 DUF4185 domain-containing protein [Mucilaginibacter sp. Bleaf8]